MAEFSSGAFGAGACVGNLDCAAGAVGDGIIQNPEVVRAMLKSALQEPEFKGCRRVVFSLCTSQVITEVVTVPNLAEKRLEKLIQTPAIETVTVLIQKEVAKRLSVAQGDSDGGSFSLFLQYYMDTEYLFDVPREKFLPAPKVTSAVIQLKCRKQLPWDIADKDIFFRVVRASFAMRRKKLSNGLASGFPELGKTGAAEVIEAAGFDANVRGETLGIPEFARIANEIVRRKTHV